jgi:hypothetical protein
MAKAGLVTLALALLLPWSFGYWLQTRTFGPVNRPVLLEAGKVQTEYFTINLREDYHVRLDVQQTTTTGRMRSAYSGGGRTAIGRCTG